ncbi:MAG: 50S ribosomal protein L16 [Bacteroidota bacterium]|nr:50S ribosomal protein L16 [Bacteroidota bacterium]
MLQPKKTTYRKQQKQIHKGIASRGFSISFGEYGLKSLEAAFVTSRQLEAARVALSRGMNRQGSTWIRVFPDKPMTKKPAEVRMGKGKGAPEYWVAPVKPGTVLFETSGVTKEVALEALRLAAQKLPIKVRFVSRYDLQLQ